MTTEESALNLICRLDEGTRNCRPVDKVMVKRELLDIFEQAPPAVRQVLVNILTALNICLNALNNTAPMVEQAGMVISDWQSLLLALTEFRLHLDRLMLKKKERLRHFKQRYIHLANRFTLLTRAYEQQTLMIEIFYDLINAGQDFQTAHQVLEQSSEILLRELESDLYVCRMRKDNGEWENIVSNSSTQHSVPMLVHFLEEDLPEHPVMRAVSRQETMYVLSNNLQGFEKGGDSFDCVAYQEGYRSRLTFILREGESQAFGIIMLYSLAPNYYNKFDKSFLADCSKLVSLTVGQRLNVGRDALAKASGGMAHVGNNVLGIMLNYIGILTEEFEDLSEQIDDVLENRAEECLAVSKNHIHLECVEAINRYRNIVLNLDVNRKMDYLNEVLECVYRLKKTIDNLLQAVNHPVLMPYISGYEVLDLEAREEESP